nr:helix-turn-helix domain-containing protein [Piscirickettsia salmonis]
MVYRHLNEKDRFYIEQRLSEGDSLRSIARALGFSPSTISREIKRHTPIDFKGLYCHRLTSRCAQEKRANAKQGQAFRQISEEAKMLIHQRLSTHTSPDVISQELIREHDIQVSESTIYRYIYDDREQGGELYKNLPHSGKPYKLCDADIPNGFIVVAFCWRFCIIGMENTLRGSEAISKFINELILGTDILFFNIT